MATIIEGTISHGALLEGPGAVFHTGPGSTIIGSSKAQNFVPSSATRLVSEILNKGNHDFMQSYVSVIYIITGMDK